MNSPLFCTSWPIQLPEPGASDPVARVRAQEEFIGASLAPWLISADSWRESLHSFHLMRYLDPSHLAPVGGIVIELRLLASSVALAGAEPEVDNKLQDFQARGLLSQYYRKPREDWSSSVGAEYGGSEVAEYWALFLASGTALALHLLRNRTDNFEARSQVIDNWLHCFSLITRCKGEQPGT